MKRLLLILTLLFTLSASAEMLIYRSTSFSYIYIDDDGRWTNWIDWEPSDCKIVFDVDDDLITIYSKSPQVYEVVDYLGCKYDDGGGKQAIWSVKDSKDLEATIRLRLEKTGNIQLYVNYSDMVWAYNLRSYYQDE